MKKVKMIMMTALLLAGVSATFGQDGSRKENMKAKKEKIKAMKIAYITEKLELSTEESEKFWPVYNKHEDQRRALKKSAKEKHDPATPMTEEKANEMINQSIIMKQKELDLYKTYVSELKGVLPSTKILKLHRAEREFKRVLLKKMKERKEGGPHNPGPQGH